jgi:hypothetical protein
MERHNGGLRKGAGRLDRAIGGEGERPIAHRRDPRRTEEQHRRPHREAGRDLGDAFIPDGVT